MISLANDLVRKSAGHTHKIPSIIEKKGSKPELTGRYLDESGQPTSILVIADRYGVSTAKVRHLFDRFNYQDVYKNINRDLRKSNGKRGVYFDNKGQSISSQALANYYGVSRSTVQRKYRENGKDYKLANKALEEYKAN